jgi:hypothetical protein
MLSWVSLALIYHEGVALIALNFEADFQNFGNVKPSSLWISILVNLSINAMAFIFVIKLLGFHIYLKINGLTTYRFIVQ